MAKKNTLSFAERCEVMEVLKQIVAEPGFKRRKTWVDMASFLSSRSGKVVTPKFVQELASVAGIDKTALVSGAVAVRATGDERLKALELQIAELQKAFEQLLGELRCDKEPMPEPLKGDQDIDSETMPVSPY